MKDMGRNITILSIVEIGKLINKSIYYELVQCTVYCVQWEYCFQILITTRYPVLYLGASSTNTPNDTHILKVIKLLEQSGMNFACTKTYHVVWYINRLKIKQCFRDLNPCQAEKGYCFIMHILSLPRL